MSKEKKENKSKEVETNVKDAKKSRKEKVASAKKIEKKAMQNEKKKLEDKIDSLMLEKKATKDKAKKKEIKSEIKDIKKQRSRIGKKDTYLSDVMAEMKLVRWPSKTEIVKYSIASLVFVLFFALFFFGIDALFALVKDLID